MEMIGHEEIYLNFCLEVSWFIQQDLFHRSDRYLGNEEGGPLVQARRECGQGLSPIELQWQAMDALANGFHGPPHESWLFQRNSSGILTQGFWGTART